MPKASPLAVVLFSLLLLSGCVVGDFISVYFNTYYNAQRLFDEAVGEVWQRPDVKKTGREYLSEFEIQEATKKKFAAVIEKCSKLLQYHPDSRYVPDALMMIGESYYYQDEDEQAARKFNELINGYPDNGLAPKAMLWLSYASYRSGRKAEAADTAAQVVALAGQRGDDAIEAQASTLLGRIAAEQKDYAAAERHYTVAAEKSGSNEEKSEAYLRLGETFALDQKYEQADSAYGEAKRFANDYLGEYRAGIGQARMLRKEGRYATALSRLEEMRSNLNYREFFAEIDLERGNVLRDQGEYAAAVDQYRIVDTTYARTESAASACYELGQLYETQLFQYDSALAAYKRGVLQPGGPTLTPLLKNRSEILGRYEVLASRLAGYDTLLNPGPAAPPDSVQASADSAGTDSMKAASAKPPGIPRDTLLARQAFDQNEIASLFYSQLQRPDSAENRYLQLLKEHPGSPYTPRAYYILAQIYSQDSTIPSGTVDSLYRRIVDQYPNSEFAVEAARALGVTLRKQEIDPAETLYARAESLMVAGSGDAALDTLNALRRRYPDSQLAPKAQYGIAWVYENLKNLPDSALANYRLLVHEYPTSVYALKVQPILAAISLEKNAQSSKDTTVAPAPKAPESPEELRREEMLGRPRPGAPNRRPDEDTPPAPPQKTSNEPPSPK